MGERRGFLGLLRKRGNSVSVLASNDHALSDPYEELGFTAPVAGAHRAVVAAPARDVVAA